MTYKTEFADFELDLIIPSEWIDHSWHNDSCPSFSNTTESLRVFVDYSDIKDREIREGERFNVEVTPDGNSIGEFVFDGDDWADITLLMEMTDAMIEEVKADPELLACKSFSDLHDVCDANCLAGLGEDDHVIWSDKYYKGEDGHTDIAMKIMNTAQNAVDSFLKERNA